MAQSTYIQKPGLKNPTKKQGVGLDENGNEFYFEPGGGEDFTGQNIWYRTAASIGLIADGTTDNSPVLNKFLATVTGEKQRVSIGFYGTVYPAKYLFNTAVVVPASINMLVLFSRIGMRPNLAFTANFTHPDMELDVKGCSLTMAGDLSVGWYQGVNAFLNFAKGDAAVNFGAGLQMLNSVTSCPSMTSSFITKLAWIEDSGVWGNLHVVCDPSYNNSCPVYFAESSFIGNEVTITNNGTGTGTRYVLDDSVIFGSAGCPLTFVKTGSGDYAVIDSCDISHLDKKDTTDMQIYIKNTTAFINQTIPAHITKMPESDALTKGSMLATKALAYARENFIA